MVDSLSRKREAQSPTLTKVEVASMPCPWASKQRQVSPEAREEKLDAPWPKGYTGTLLTRVERV